MSARARAASYCGVVASLIAVWWLLAATNTVSPVLLPSPPNTWSSLRSIVGQPDVVWTAVANTVEPLLEAFVVAVVIGIIAGTVVGRSPLLSAAYEPLLANLNTIPVIALYPLLAGALGVGALPKFLCAMLAATFPVAIATARAVRHVDRNLLAAARSLGATPYVRTLTTTLPAAAPAIFAGLRTALGLATVTVIAGEFIASTAGLGYELAASSQSLDTSDLFAWLVITLVLTTVLNGLLTAVELVVFRRIRR